MLPEQLQRLMRVLLLASSLLSATQARADGNAASHAPSLKSPEDFYAYADELASGGKYREAMQWYQEAAKRSHAGAQFALATAYLEGRGVRENPKQAVKWLKRAAKSGHTEGQYMLGMQYQEGNGVAHSTKDAARWLQAAAEAGHSAARLSAGLMALNGVGMERNVQRGVRWLTLAAEGGDETAQLNMGLMQLAGQAGLGQDNRAAARWFHLAADHGNSIALFNLGALYARGQGVDQDFVEAWKWFELARLKGDDSAEVARDQIAQALTPSGIRRAGQFADAWLGAH